MNQIKHVMHFALKLALCSLSCLLLGEVGFTQTDNSNWNFVGPFSENIVADNKFETAQLNVIAVDENDPQIIATGGRYAGLWLSTDQAETWESISTIPTGANGVTAMAFDQQGDLIVGNAVIFWETGIDLSRKPNKSLGVFKYSVVNNQWYSLGTLPVSTSDYMINAIEVHPNDNNMVFVGTTHGLFRSTDGGTIWSLVPTAEESIREILFSYNSILHHVKKSKFPT